MRSESFDVPRRAIAAAATCAVLAAALGGWWWFRVPPAEAPRRPAALSRAATSQGWTINGQPVEDGLTLPAGTLLDVAVQVRPSLDAPKPASKNSPAQNSPAKWSATGPWTPGVDEFDVWMRFAQETPWSEMETRSNLHWLIKKRPKKVDEPHRATTYRAPQRIGEYEVQLVVQKRKRGAFAVDQTIEGDVLATARVRVVPAE